MQLPGVASIASRWYFQNDAAITLRSASASKSVAYSSVSSAIRELVSSFIRAWISLVAVRLLERNDPGAERIAIS